MVEWEEAQVGDQHGCEDSCGCEERRDGGEG